MYFNHIKYDLACKNCRNIRMPEMTMLQSDEDIDHMSREELIAEMDNFEHIQCDNCGEYGNWLVFKIQLNDNDEVRDQFKINLIKEDERIYGKPEDGYYSPAQIEIAFSRIRNKIEEMKGQNFSSRPDGSAFIMVDFIKNEPYSRVSIFNIDGFSIKEISEIIDAMSGIKAPKPVSIELIEKLEDAFENFKNDTQNPPIIAHLQSEEAEVNIYLIAKDPKDETYYGIIENEFTYERKIARIPLSNIQDLKVEEVPMDPFRAKEYIENGIKRNG